jgi:tetratricopeptide (TPR) repeat protein
MSETNPSSAQAKEDFAQPASGQIVTTFGHRCFTLIGSTFLLFECFFLSVYGSDSWFETDISSFGIPAILLAFVCTHFILRWVESPAGCHFFSPIWKFKPPVVYWRLGWLKDSEIIFGAKHVKLEAIDELALSFFGNLLVSSRSICGPTTRRADLIVKIPVGAASVQTQRRFVETVRACKPELKTNRRLEKRLASTDLKGAAAVQSFGVAFMVLVLLDLGNSTFRFLQMNKEYYLTQTSARDGDLKQAAEHFQKAEYIHDHPFPFSWVNTKLLGQGVAAAGVHQLRSEALWSLGRKSDAVAEARAAVDSSKDSFRMHLRLARLLSDTGDLPGSRAQIRLAIKNHRDSLLPRLYMLAELAANGNDDQLKRLYQIYLDEMGDLVYGEEPWWPPGGNRFSHEIFFSDDVTFIFDRLLHTSYKKEKS